MLAVPGNFTVELPRKLINICLVSHLDCQCQEKIQHKWNFFRIDISTGNKTLWIVSAWKGWRGEKMFYRGGASDLGFTLGIIQQASMKTCSTELLSLSPLGSQPLAKHSGSNASRVTPKWLPENLEKYAAPNSPGSTSLLHRKEHGCVFKVQGWTFRGTLTYKYSPGHRYRNSVWFLQDLLCSVSTEWIHVWNQIHCRLWQVPLMANHAAWLEQAHDTSLGDNTAALLHLCFPKITEGIFMEFSFVPWTWDFWRKATFPSKNKAYPVWCNRDCTLLRTSIVLLMTRVSWIQLLTVHSTLENKFFHDDCWEVGWGMLCASFSMN